ncbi:MAG TPA: hypothetical protein VGO07_00135 [Candidatus Saccharimonadales bacterium]|nr:hypothetical protein [Candidatus Saccharimonadales bacterium]
MTKYSFYDILYLIDLFREEFLSMVKAIIGGVVVLVIGGTTVAVSNSDIADNFSKNTGMTKQQAQQYVGNIQKSDLESFSKVGQDLVSDGNLIQTELSSIDCVNYTYKWETASLSCQDARNEFQTISNDETALGNCYQTLDTNLGNSAKLKMNECISDIDVVNADYDLPVATTFLDSNTLTKQKNTNIYNKSVLEAALQSN